MSTPSTAVLKLPKNCSKILLLRSKPFPALLFCTLLLNAACQSFSEPDNTPSLLLHSETWKKATERKARPTQPYEAPAREYTIHADSQESALGASEVLASLEDNTMRDGQIITILNEGKSVRELTLTLPGVVLSKKQNNLCAFISGSSGESIVGAGRSFLCSPKTELDLERRYTALRYLDEAIDPATDASIGHRYGFVAEVIFQRVFNSKYLVQGDVIKSRLDLRKGDIIVPYLALERSFTLALPKAKLRKAQAHILAFGEEGKALGGRGDFVYLDRGLNHGLRDGDVLAIDQNFSQSLRNYEQEEPKKDTIKVGILQVIATSKVGAIGYILENSTEILLGDQVGKSVK